MVLVADAVPQASQPSTRPHKPVWGALPQLPHAPHAPYVPRCGSPLRPHALLLARWAGADRAIGCAVVRDDVLDAPAASSSSARRCADEVWSAAARLAALASECGRVGRGDGRCAFSLRTRAPDEHTSIGAAVKVTRPRTARMLMDCCSGGGLDCTGLHLGSAASEHWKVSLQLRLDGRTRHGPVRAAASFPASGGRASGSIQRSPSGYIKF